MAVSTMLLFLLLGCLHCVLVQSEAAALEPPDVLITTGDVSRDSNTSIAHNVHAFFYLWYGNPTTDGRYLHWDHAVLPHWAESTRRKFPHGHRHAAAEGEIHARYYPQRGLYSSNDPDTLDAQMQVGRIFGRPG